MQELTQGSYSGNIIHSRVGHHLLASMTNYNSHDFNGTLHYHHNAHFSFALNGGCVEKKKESYEILPGDITYYSAGEIHQVLRVPLPTRRVNLELEPHFFEMYGFSDRDARCAVSQNPEAKFLMVKIASEMLLGDGLSELTICMLLLQLISTHRKQEEGQGVPQWVGRVREFLHEHTEAQLSLADLSALSGLHPVHISKWFSKYFSCTVGEYKRKLKVEKAIGLLKSNPSSLTEVACRCGFFDQSHFIHTFKTQTGLLPGQFIKM